MRAVLLLRRDITAHRAIDNVTMIRVPFAIVSAPMVTVSCCASAPETVKTAFGDVRGPWVRSSGPVFLVRRPLRCFSPQDLHQRRISAAYRTFFGARCSSAKTASRREILQVASFDAKARSIAFPRQLVRGAWRSKVLCGGFLYESLALSWSAGPEATMSHSSAHPADLL